MPLWDGMTDHRPATCLRRKIPDQNPLDLWGLQKLSIDIGHINGVCTNLLFLNFHHTIYQAGIPWSIPPFQTWVILWGKPCPCASPKIKYRRHCCQRIWRHLPMFYAAKNRLQTARAGGVVSAASPVGCPECGGSGRGRLAKFNGGRRLLYFTIVASVNDFGKRKTKWDVFAMLLRVHRFIKSVIDMTIWRRHMFYSINITSFSWPAFSLSYLRDFQ